MNTVVREQTFANERKLQLVQGDITDEAVDAIVNAANAYLAHGSGVAGAVVRRGGRQIQVESDRWVQEHGRVSHAEPAYTRAGNLLCRYVIHAVGPRWGEGDEEAKLEAAVSGSLRRAEQLGLGSIALPAISTGVFGFPVALAAKVTLTTIINQLAGSTSSSLSLVRVVLYDQETLQAFIDQWERNDQLNA